MRLGLPQEGRPTHQGQGQEQLGLSQAAQLPSRHRIGHLVFEARLRSGALRLARARPLQGLRLVVSRRLQPCPLCPAQGRGGGGGGGGGGGWVGVGGGGGGGG